MTRPRNPELDTAQRAYLDIFGESITFAQVQRLVYGEKWNHRGFRSYACLIAFWGSLRGKKLKDPFVYSVKCAGKPDVVAKFDKIAFLKQGDPLKIRTDKEESMGEILRSMIKGNKTRSSGVGMHSKQQVNPTRKEENNKTINPKMVNQNIDHQMKSAAITGGGTANVPLRKPQPSPLLSFAIPIVPPSINSVGRHWGFVYQRQKKWKGYLLVVKANSGFKFFQDIKRSLEVVVYWPKGKRGTRLPDVRNVSDSLKPIVDMMVTLGFLADDNMEKLNDSLPIIKRAEDFPCPPNTDAFEFSVQRGWTEFVLGDVE